MVMIGYKGKKSRGIFTAVLDDVHPEYKPFSTIDAAA